MTVGLVDFGNTRFKVALVNSAGELSSVKGYAYPMTDQPGFVAETIHRLMPDVQCYVASGKGELFDHAFQEEFIKKGGRPLRYVKVSQRDDLHLAYADVSTFGVDRYLGLLGAIALGEKNVLVIDAGTAITFDALEGRQHRGGCIFPGLGLLKQGLVSGGMKIVLGDDGEAPDLFACGTASGVKGGVGWGLLGAVKSISSKMLLDMPPCTRVILTGGDALVVGEALSASFRVESTLLFAGMNKLLSEC